MLVLYLIEEKTTKKTEIMYELNELNYGNLVICEYISKMGMSNNNK